MEQRGQEEIRCVLREVPAQSAQEPSPSGGEGLHSRLERRGSALRCLSDSWSPETLGFSLLKSKTKKPPLPEVPSLLCELNKPISREVWKTPLLPLGAMRSSRTVPAVPSPGMAVRARLGGGHTSPLGAAWGSCFLPSKLGKREALNPHFSKQMKLCFSNFLGQPLTFLRTNGF